tara:strand:- start:237 stop:632 length:396 start_codon:yes stop_codon:yes gene_type:complete
MSWRGILKQDTVTNVAEKIYQKIKGTPQMYSNGIISITMGDRKGLIHIVGKKQPLVFLGQSSDAELNTGLYKDDDQKYITLLNEVLDDPELNGENAIRLRRFISNADSVAMALHREDIKNHDYSKIDWREL